MLILLRHVDEVIDIGPDISIKVIEVRRGGRVRLGIEAPDGVLILRRELKGTGDSDAGSEGASRSDPAGGGQADHRDH